MKGEIKMDENENNIPEEGLEDNIIILNDENGEEVPFEFLDLIELDGEEYMVLLPVEEIPAVRRPGPEWAEDSSRPDWLTAESKYSAYSAIHRNRRPTCWPHRSLQWCSQCPQGRRYRRRSPVRGTSSPDSSAWY